MGPQSSNQPRMMLMLTGQNFSLRHSKTQTLDKCSKTARPLDHPQDHQLLVDQLLSLKKSKKRRKKRSKTLIRVVFSVETTMITEQRRLPMKSHESYLRFKISNI